MQLTSCTSHNVPDSNPGRLFTGRTSPLRTTHLHNPSQLLARRHHLVNDRRLESGLLHDILCRLNLSLGPSPLECQQTTSRTQQRRRKTDELRQVRDSASGDGVEPILDLFRASMPQDDIVQVELGYDIVKPLDPTLHRFYKHYF